MMDLPTDGIVRIAVGSVPADYVVLGARPSTSSVDTIAFKGVWTLIYAP